MSLRMALVAGLVVAPGAATPAMAAPRIAVTGRSGDRFAVRIDGARAHFDPLLPTLCVLVPEACGGLQGPLPG